MKFRLETGRTHQIRVHSAYIGHPVYGDDVYGKAVKGIEAKKMTADDNLDLIIDSYKDKANKDIYFPKCWRNVYGNNKKYFGWDY